MLLWCLQCIEMYFSCGFLVKGDLTTRQISGGGGGGQKGTVDLFMFKKELLMYLTGSFLDTHVLSTEARKLIRDALISHQRHHDKFGWPKDAVQPDLTWHASWLESERSVLFLLEAR